MSNNPIYLTIVDSGESDASAQVLSSNDLAVVARYMCLGVVIVDEGEMNTYRIDPATGESTLTGTFYDGDLERVHSHLAALGQAPYGQAHGYDIWDVAERIADEAGLESAFDVTEEMLAAA